MTAKLGLFCLALATSTAAAHPCPAPTPKAVKPAVAKPTEQEVTLLYQKAADRIRIAAIVDADAARNLSARLKTIKATHAIETIQGRRDASAALTKLASDAEAVLP